MKILFLGLVCGVVLFVVGAPESATGQVPTPSSIVKRECKSASCTLDGLPPVVVARFRCQKSDESLFCTNSFGPNCNWVCTDY